MQNATKHTEHTDQDTTPKRSVQEAALHIWSLVLNQVKHIKPAAVAIALFVALLFTFVVKANQRQNLATAMLPTDSTNTEAVQTDSAQVGTAVVAAKTQEMTEQPSKYVIGEKL